jgi:hypothetical protein
MLLAALPADQNPGGVSVGGVTGVVIILGLAAATLLSVLLLFGLGRGRARRVTGELAADVERGLALLAEQLNELATEPIAGAQGAGAQGAGAQGAGAAGASAPAGAELARRDAQERLAAARELHGAGPGRNLPVLRAIRHILLEGLTAAHEARRLAGLDQGPMPPPPTDAPLVAALTPVEVAGLTWQANPGYVPGAVHHFGGGRLAGVDVPGGWYAQAFWVPLLEPPQSAPQTAVPLTGEGTQGP